ncbi:MAG: UxaA family hydrolase [Lachnospiraceae bacterium]|nr:UxaA family hydrolase [Lachnospiraceae bacterium]
MTEGASRDDLCLQLFDLCVQIASGRAVKSELAGFHDMAIFKQGVTL